MGTRDEYRSAALIASAASSLAIASLGLVLLIAELIDVFVRHQWVTRYLGDDSPGPTTTPMAPLPFLWQGDENRLQLAATAMLIVGMVTAVLAMRWLQRSTRGGGLIPVTGRLALAAGITGAVAHILVMSGNIVSYSSGSTCDTVRLLPWLELAAVLGLIGAGVGLRAVISIGHHTDRESLKALSLGGATVGLGGAVIGLCASVIVLHFVVGPQCPW